ncbi:MAG: hypothetical protein NTW65_10855 [Deltaproteobacteria bacterium]|nr:hypothetical protein [Deltaproteobacteria bacterium]
MNDRNNRLNNENTGRMKSTGISSPTDLKQISRIISALNLIKMNIGMYPDGHSSIDKSVEQAYTLIQDYLQGRSEIIIGVAGKTLMLNDNVLDKKNNTFREYAHALNLFRVIFFSLKHTVTRKDLFQFSRILSSNPSDIRTMSKLEDLLARTSVKGIQVKTIDADYFQLTDDKKTRKTMTAEDFWLEFFSQMSFNASNTELKNYDTEKSVDSGLPKAIRTLNDKRQYWQKAVVSYENMIQDYLYDIRAGMQVGADKYDALAKIANLMNNFHPDLKEQLLEVAERQLSLQPETALILENMEYLPEEMLHVIIHLANEREKQVSPALIMLLHKLSAIKDGGEAHQQVDRQNMTFSEMGKLMKREEYEEYIPEKYSQLLKKLSSESSTATDVAEDAVPFSVYLKTIDDENIDFRICKLVLALMEEETDEENYLAYSTRLAVVIPNLLKKGQFLFLTSVIETLRRHGNNNASEKIRRQASSVLSILVDPDTVARCITPFILRKQDTTVVAKFLVMSGVQNIHWIFDLYLNPETKVSDTLLDIIKGFGSDAVDEASKRMENQTPLKAVRLLSFLQAVGNHSTIPLLKELYKYDNYDIKKEVLRILFLFKDSGGIDLLRKSIHSSNCEEVQQAVSLIFLFEVKELMGELMSLLKTFYIREEDSILNEWIVQQLGDTGNPWAVPYMKTIMSVRFTLFPQRLSRMKGILYESLEHFPRQAVQSLLEGGSKSRNRRIRASCLKIMGQKES